MVQILKRDFQVNSLYSIGTFIFVPLVYMMNGSIVIIYMFAVFFFHFYAFYLDDKAQINQFLVILPINKKIIVLSKYVFMLIRCCILIVYYLIIDILLHYGVPYLESHPIDALSLVFILSGVMLALAISLPIYYYCKSFQIAFFVHLFILLFGAYFLIILTSNPYINFSKATFFLFALIEV